MVALPDASVSSMTPSLSQVPFLRVPPFPGARFRDFKRSAQPSEASPSLAECVALVREKRVGGTYWGAQPDLPPSYVLVRSAAALESSEGPIEQYGPIVAWLASGDAARPPAQAVTGECDPWHMLGNAGALVCDADDEVRLVAAILRIPTFITDPNGGPAQRSDGDIDAMLSNALPVAGRFSNPFGGAPLLLTQVIELSAFWRSLIDSNRSIGSGVGFAFWKQKSVLPLLWNGGETTDFFRPSKAAVGAVAIWRSKASPDLIGQLERRGTPLVEVEDGFLRSAGLGADCVPPLSITVDHLGPYFDPGQASELENLLEHGQFDAALVDRARRLRETIVAAGIGKYDQDATIIERFDASRRHILVAGQVEDDRSILSGGAGLSSNLELLQRVRAHEPDAFVIYKPHPDVVAGHRKGYIAEHVGRQFADKIVNDGSISSLIAMVDEVHVNTSLAGFEALMRFKDVTTYGVPFYAGWGLTRDLGPVPARRTAKRSLDELVAATLLLYPRYLDPVSGLPCPAEIVVDRLATPAAKSAGALVRLRRLQGRLKRRLTAWRAA